MSDQDIFDVDRAKDQRARVAGSRRFVGNGPGHVCLGTWHSLRAGKPTKVFRALVKAKMAVEELEVRVQTLMNELSRGDQRLRSEMDKLYREIKEMSVRPRTGAGRSQG